jgi:hypothetical protein
MAVVQNTFVENLDKGYPGMEADGELSNIVTRSLEGAAVLPFGRPVYKGAGDRGCVLTVTALTLIGFAIADKGLPLTTARTVDTYAPLDNVAVKERGKIWVTSTTAAAKDALVYVVPGTGAITNASAGNVLADGWKFDDTIAAAGIVRIVRR